HALGETRARGLGRPGRWPRHHGQAPWLQRVARRPALVQPRTLGDLASGKNPANDGAIANATGDPRRGSKTAGDQDSWRSRTMPHEALRALLPIAGWSENEAGAVTFSGGSDPVLPTPFRIGTAAAATLAASGLAAAPRGGRQSAPGHGLIA